MIFQEYVPLAPLTTLQVGGPARYFAEAQNDENVRDAADFAKSRQLPLFVLGGGSNVLVADEGWPGLVLQVAIGGMTNERSGDDPVFHVGAGYNWDEFVSTAVAQNCAGIECLSGIPGTVGGTPVQNVGAYGQEVAETIESVNTFDIDENRVVNLSRTECGFRYRASIFNQEARGRYVILSVRYRLRYGGMPGLKYGDLQRYFAESKTPPSLFSVREAVLNIRGSKGMVIDPADGDCRSVGSFFKNPVISDEQHQRLVVRASARGLAIPSYPALEAHHKMSAAWLVEHSGFRRGFRLGSVGLSSKHALALVNKGGARADDIVRLKTEIQERVQSEWGVTLEPEPVFVGF